MRPVLFEVFGLKIQGYGTMIAIGIISAIFLLEHRAKKAEYNEDKILNMSIVAVLFGVLGGKILYIITDLKNIAKHPLDIITEFGSGFVIYGAIMGGALGIYIYCKKNKWDILKIFDLVIPVVALAQGFGRIGCFLAGCCYGKPTDLPIGVVFTHSHFAPSGVPVHPTQLYCSIFDFLLAFFLLWYDKKRSKDGRVFAFYVIIYSVGRFLVEYLRGDLERGHVGILSTSQFISLFTVVVGLIIFNIDNLKLMIKGHRR